jgi:hypothetical protein
MKKDLNKIERDTVLVRLSIKITKMEEVEGSEEHKKAKI